MEKIKKGFWAGCLVLVVAVGALTGCSSTLMSVENSTSTSYSMRYQKFNGTKDRTMKLEAGDVINCDIVTEDGSLNVTIEAPSGKACYTGTDIPTSTFAVSTEEDGSYTIYVEADNHSGSYTFDWSDN